MKRRTVYIWAILGSIFALAVVNKAINPHAGNNASVARHAAAIKALKARSAPAAQKEDPAVEASRRQFREYCIDAVRAKLQFPATFKGHYFFAGPPWLVTRRSDHSTSWMWSFSFEASNGYGAVGRYRGTCDQTKAGEVFAVITLAD